MSKKEVKFRAIKTIKKPVTVIFTTKGGDKVSFKATKTERKPVTIKFRIRK